MGFSPPYFVPGYKKVPFFYKSRTCEGLKKDSFFREIRNAGGDHQISLAIMGATAMNGLTLPMDKKELTLLMPRVLSSFAHKAQYFLNAAM